MWQSGDQTWCCPFCQAQVIKVFYRPAHREIKTVRGSGQSASETHHKPPEVKILTPVCPSCGKSKKEIEEKLLY